MWELILVWSLISKSFTTEAPKPLHSPKFRKETCVISTRSFFFFFDLFSIQRNIDCSFAVVDSVTHPRMFHNFWPNESLQSLSLLREQTQCNHSQITVKEKQSKAKKKRLQSQILVFCKSRLSSPSITHGVIKNSPSYGQCCWVQELPFHPLCMAFSLFFCLFFLLLRHETLWCMGFGLGRLAFFLFISSRQSSICSASAQDNIWSPRKFSCSVYDA